MSRCVLTALFVWIGLFSSSTFAVTSQTIIDGLKRPWSMVFLPGEEILISERGGTLRRVVAGRLLKKPVSGLPDIEQHGQGGLMGLALHPGFVSNRWLYFAHLDENRKGVALAVSRGKYRDGSLKQVERIYTASPHSKSGQHFGGRLVFADDGSLFVTHGDRGARKEAQNPNNVTGALLRLSDTGASAANTGKGDWLAEVVSIGHRNIQGAALHPDTRKLWIHEHGPKGGDEINTPKPGKNYGWPLTTHGKEYSGRKVGKGLTALPGLEPPIYHWTPSIAPSGMAFYDHPRFPQWQGKLFVGSLKFKLLVELELDGETIISERRRLKGKHGRIRDVQQGPDGFLYFLTDANRGKLVRVAPGDPAE